MYFGGDSQPWVIGYNPYWAGIDGGKYNLLDYILPFPRHTTFIEVFGGSSVVLFNKIPSQIEIVNDINSRLINFWETIQKARREFVDYCKNEGGLDSRVLFDKYRKKADKKVEDAFRLYYINRHSFSQMNNAYHGISFTGNDQWHSPYLNKLEHIDEYYERIKHVQFESQCFRRLLKRCDRENACIYLDPPYFKGGDIYEYMVGVETSWSHQEFVDLRTLLKGLKKAKFVLSIDEKNFWLEEMPDLYIQPIERINNASLSIGKEKSRSIEYVIRNYNPKTTPTMRDFDGKNKIKNDMEL